MKKIILNIAVLISITLTAHTQTISYYDTCQNLQQYAGEWRYVNGTDTIKFYLRCHRYISKNPFSNLYRLNDNLFGWHEYKQGGTIIESNYQYRFTSLPYDFVNYIDNSSIDLYMPNGCDNNLFRLKGSITDYNQQERFHNLDIKIDSSRTLMNCFVYPMGGTMGGILNPHSYTGTTLPTRFTLVKQ